MSDLISRQAAIEAIERNAYRHTYLDQIINIISNLPSAEVTLCHLDSPCEYQNADIAMPTAEKVGKWKYETMRHIITGEMRTVRICSECGGGWFRYDLSDGVEDAEPNYCPNCGARMEGEEDE